MKRLLISLIISFCFSQGMMGQAPYTCEFGMISDNDAYYFLAMDQYYTNGLMLFFKYVPKRFNDNLANKIIEFSVVQKIYNPFQAYVPWVERMDKPFAGYLYFQGGISRIYRNESMLRTDLQLGIMGPSAMAEEVQSFYHRVFNLYGIDGWEYQVHDAFGINLHFSYLKSLSYFRERHYDISLITNLNAGTIHADVCAGFITRASIYSLQPVNRSNISGSTICRNGDSPSINELYIYIKPMLCYTAYDATIQGSMFSDSSPVTFDVRPVRLLVEIGVSGSYKNFIAGYALVFQTREARNNLVKSHLYGSITFACRF